MICRAGRLALFLVVTLPMLASCSFANTPEGRRFFSALAIKHGC